MQPIRIMSNEDKIATLLAQFDLNKPDDQTRIPAFYAVMPATIRCCPSVQDFHHKRSIVPISLAEFLKTRALREYNPSLKLTECDLLKVWSDTMNPKQHVTEIEEGLFDARYTDRFVVVNMGEMGDGLFLAHDAKPIKAGSIVLTYSGDYRKLPLDNQTDDSDYVLSIPTPSKESRNSALLTSEVAHFVDAQNGNLARFIQGGLDLTDLMGNTQIGGKKKILKKAAIGNLLERVVIYRGFPMIGLQSLRDIMPGEILTYGYGPDYFGGQRNITQQVTDDKGTVIASVVNRILMPTRDIKEISRLPDAQRLDLKQARQIVVTPLTREEMLFDYQKQFYHSVCHALSTASTLLAYSKHRKFMEEKLAEFQKIDKPSARYEYMQGLMKMPVFKDELTSLRLYLVGIILDFAKHEKLKGSGK